MSKTVIEMAREAGCVEASHPFNPWSVNQEALERFAELVRVDAIAAEREACVNVAGDSDHVVGGRGYYDQLGDADATVRNIVAAMQARGQE